MDPSYALYALIFVGVLLAVEGVTQLVGEPRNGSRAINRRLRMLAAGTDPEQVLQSLRRSSEAVGLARLTSLAGVARLVTQSGVRLNLRAIILIMALLSLVIAVLLRPWLGIELGLGVAFPVGIGGPLLFLRQRRGRRLKTIAGQLPDTIDLIVRSLRAGHPLNAALKIAAREVPDPLGSEIGLLVDEVTYGKSLPEAALAMAERIGLEEIRYLVVAIKVQHGTGGNLAEILTALARVVRERAAMVLKIRAVSAEGRLSATVLSIFPACLAGIIQLTSPTFFGDVANDPLFLPMVGFVLLMMLINTVVTRRLVNFDF